jgi:hypothetical protein
MWKLKRKVDLRVEKELIGADKGEGNRGQRGR